MLKDFQRTEKESRTQLEYATSWSRAFTKILTDLKWINAFARLNVIACQKSLQRMAKTYLVVQDNIVDKYLLVKTKEWGERFYNSQNEIIELQRQIIQFYAD